MLAILSQRKGYDVTRSDVGIDRFRLLHSGEAGRIDTFCLSAALTFASD